MGFSQEVVDWLNEVNESNFTMRSQESAYDQIDCNGLRLVCIDLEQPRTLKHFTGSIHLWEDLWRTRRKTVEGRLLFALGKATKIHGRQTNITKLSQPEIDEFISSNHLLPPINGKHKLGLTFKGKLVSVALFSKSCPIHRNGKIFTSIEMTRFCHANGTTVVGGMTKLLKHLIKAQSPDDIMTYVATEWSQGGAFEKVGFTPVEHTEPVSFWIHPKTFERVYSFKAEADQQMLSKGFIQYHNQGSQKLILDLT